MLRLSFKILGLMLVLGFTSQGYAAKALCEEVLREGREDTHRKVSRTLQALMSEAQEGQIQLMPEVRKTALKTLGLTDIPVEQLRILAGFAEKNKNSDEGFALKFVDEVTNQEVELFAAGFSRKDLYQWVYTHTETRGSRLRNAELGKPEALPKTAEIGVVLSGSTPKLRRYMSFSKFDSEEPTLTIGIDVECRKVGAYVAPAGQYRRIIIGRGEMCRVPILTIAL